MTVTEGAVLHTIGYEGADLNDFLQTLQAAKVSLVVDVRERAQSRRRGFSKSALRENLSNAGIAYIHLRELGDPKEGREAARSNNIDRFKEIFSAVLETAEARKAVRIIADAMEDQSICLLCYERDQRHCDRTMVADRITTLTGIRARHLGVREFGAAN